MPHSETSPYETSKHHSPWYSTSESVKHVKPVKAPSVPQGAKQQHDNTIR